MKRKVELSWIEEIIVGYLQRNKDRAKSIIEQALPEWDEHMTKYWLVSHSVRAETVIRQAFDGYALRKIRKDAGKPKGRKVESE